MTSELASWLDLAKESWERARVKRTRGDALRKLGKVEEARKAYRAAAHDFREPVDALPAEARRGIEESWPHRDLDALRSMVVDELIELYGSLGGILRRSEDHQDALASYGRGAGMERSFGSASTYNRLNAIKYQLLLSVATLDQLEPELQELSRHIEQQLATDARLSDSGWAWADLGDCRVLTGDLAGARQAYRNFVSKAETKSPATALAVLAEVARTLANTTDPKALRAIENIERLRSEFA